MSHRRCDLRKAIVLALMQSNFQTGSEVGALFAAKKGELMDVKLDYLWVRNKKNRLESAFPRGG